ncbi:hypothetical protein [Pseudomonas sp. GM21]|uniref:hypothetical protein n=1 Tax=Pseudomonas sp. GM21 TaxID=1144325 RepID=UPI0012F80099|nr:hypothetical protein [Pseudomonas sp. GM21]
MNGTQTPFARIARVHRNLELVATVATVATALLGGPLSRCHPIKKVATSGNTHISFNIRARNKSHIWLSPLPQKTEWQRNSNIGHGWRPRFTGLLPPLPLLPHFLNSQQHVYVSNPGMVEQ